jgi:hypothetical protein
MDRLFQAYIDQRNPAESFLSFARRHQIAELKAFCAPQEIEAHV